MSLYRDNDTEQIREEEMSREIIIKTLAQEIVDSINQELEGQAGSMAGSFPVIAQRINRKAVSGIAEMIEITFLELEKK